MTSSERFQPPRQSSPLPVEALRTYEETGAAPQAVRRAGKGKGKAAAAPAEARRTLHVVQDRFRFSNAERELLSARATQIIGKGGAHVELTQALRDVLFARGPKAIGT